MLHWRALRPHALRCALPLQGHTRWLPLPLAGCTAGASCGTDARGFRLRAGTAQVSCSQRFRSSSRGRQHGFPAAA